MATPTTLLELATQKRDAAQQAVSDARQRLADAQEDMATQRKELAAATAGHADLDAQAAGIRTQLAMIVTPADGQALLDALEQTIIRARTEQAAILAAGTELGAAESDADGAQTRLAGASSQLELASRSLTETKQADQQRTSWKTALAAEPLAIIHTAATLALAAPLFTDAKTRVEAAFPAKLLARARERSAREAAQIAQCDSDRLRRNAAPERASNGGPGQADKPDHLEVLKPPSRFYAERQRPSRPSVGHTTGGRSGVTTSNNRRASKTTR